MWLRKFIDYERNIKRINEWKVVRDRLEIVSKVWGEFKLDEISKDHFTKLDAYLKEKDRSEATINHYFTLLKTFFFFAIRKGYYRGENPIKEIKKRITLLLLYTGMRMGEVMRLKWDNVKDDKIVLKRTETKQNKEKVVLLTKSIRAVLEDLRDKRRRDGYVIPLRGGTKERGEIWMTDIMRKIREYSGVQDFIFHNLRHTASTIMVSEAIGKGVGLADIMKVLGHSRVETTMKYLHPEFGRMKKAMEVLEEKTKKKD